VAATSSLLRSGPESTQNRYRNTAIQCNRDPQRRQIAAMRCEWQGRASAGAALSKRRAVEFWQRCWVKLVDFTSLRSAPLLPPAQG
jgi:hypothetical protein